MHDDGRHEDAAAGDGLFGALVPDTIRGDVRARVEITGTTAERAAFLRAVQLSFPVLEPRLMLEEAATARLADARRLDVAIAALPLAPRTRLHVSAEVWGRDANGASVPVCWLSRQLEPGEPSGRAGTWSLGLALDTRWLDVARAHEPLELRAVRVQDPDTDVVLDALDRIPLVLESPLPPLGETREITPEMLTGSSSLTLGSIAPGGPLAPIGPTAIKPALMLVHGYCSGGSIWPAADFTQPKVVFLDPDENRTHDQFAQLLDQKAQATGLSSFGVVAHSQGGAAALHLFTYYASGLDLASGGRRIQSLATPYQGTPLASLGGFLCGVNNDMTPSGSATWLAGIPSWARAEVWYWTTSNSGSACQFLTDFLLTNPEDGTVEQFRGQLPGAHSMGHSTGWCHTTGMSNPASYTDHVRNQAMNAAAAR
jgi:pimeloyl-ACP methyl ester carboxylesterase